MAYGIGTEAACWSQVGYATGYVTSLFGQLVVFREVECRAARDRRRLVVAHMFRREQLPAAARQLGITRAQLAYRLQRRAPRV